MIKERKEITSGSEEEIMAMMQRPYELQTIIQGKDITINDIVVNIDTPIGEPHLYRDVYNLLRNVSNIDRITLILNTPGGYSSTTQQLVDSLLTTCARTKAEIHNASSAGSILALVCDEIEVKPFGHMMIHTMSGGIIGKEPEMKAHHKFLDKWIDEFISDIYKGFLTDEEIKQVKEGRDMWLVKKDIDKRLKKFTPYRFRS